MFGQAYLKLHVSSILQFVTLHIKTSFINVKNLFDSLAPQNTQDHSVEAHLVLQYMYAPCLFINYVHVLFLWNFLAKRKKFRFIYEHGIWVRTHQQEQHRSIEGHLLLHKLLLHGNMHPLMHFLVTGICHGHLFSFTCSNMSWTPQHTKTIKLHNEN